MTFYDYSAICPLLTPLSVLSPPLLAETLDFEWADLSPVKPPLEASPDKLIHFPDTTASFTHLVWPDGLCDPGPDEVVDLILNLKERIEQRESRLKMNSRNNSKPPGNDGYNPKSQRHIDPKRGGKVIQRMGILCDFNGVVHDASWLHYRLLYLQFYFHPSPCEPDFFVFIFFVDCAITKSE